MHMQTIHLNIGLNIAGVESLQMPQIAVALEQALPGMEIRESYIRQSATERTACIILRWGGAHDAADLHGPIMHLCDLLKQVAIAGRVFGAGRHNFLTGPKAAEWGGEFNEAYWLVPCPDNAPLTLATALSELEADISREGWTIGGISGFTSWFERDSDGTGGGLWFSSENPETGYYDGHLHLLDYDGVFALPRAVLVALRLAGVSVDNSFE
jgi:hypothetical protein